MPEDSAGLQSRIKEYGWITAGVGLSIAGLVLISRILPPIGKGGVQCDGRCAPPGSEQIAAIEQLVVWSVLGTLILIVAVMAVRNASQQEVSVDE